MPSLSNIVVKPRALVLEDGSLSGNDRRRAVVQVEGLVCNAVCVRRVLASLSEQPSVTQTSYDPISDAFYVEYASPESRSREFAEAALAPVMAPSLRAALEGCWKRLHRSQIGMYFPASLKPSRALLRTIWKFNDDALDATSNTNHGAPPDVDTATVTGTTLRLSPRSDPG